jgi:hypothetical protein
MTEAKQKPDRVIRVTKKTLKFWRDNLTRKSWNREYPAGEVMEEISKTFGVAGTRYEVVLKLVNSEPDRARESLPGGLGEPEGGPYLDAILFADGVEQCVLEPSREQLDGEYMFRDSVESRDIRVIVKGPDVKKHVLHKDDYRTEWWMEDGSVCVNVYKQNGKDENGVTTYDEKPCLEWAYGKIPGNNLIGNAAIWLDQAILQAKSTN